MDFVSGKSLDQVIFEDLIRDPLDKIRIILDASAIVESCHRHDRTILHRDLRPSNIIVDGELWSSGTYDRVTVLDFDLSWHLGASDEEYIITNANALGYLAPEQIDTKSIFSARSALVDVYGFGMLLFFVLSGRHPPGNAAYLEDWKREAFSQIRRSSPTGLSSAPLVLARLIGRATEQEQDKRPPLDVFRDTLKKVWNSCATASIDGLDIGLYEIFYSFAATEFEFSDRDKTAKYSSQAGIVVTGRAREDMDDLFFRLETTAQGTRHRATMARYFSDIAKFASEQLKALGAIAIRAETHLGSSFVEWTCNVKTSKDCFLIGAACRDIMYYITSR